MTNTLSRAVMIEIAVGDPPGGGCSIAEARLIAGAAEAAGVSALRVVDETSDGTALDPSVVVGYLAGRTTHLGYVVDIPTTWNAPYNVARRVLSLDRAVGGRVGVALRPGVSDDVSEAVAPEPSAGDPVERWAEYAGILHELWESFPPEALVGDQAAGVFARDELIRAIAHVGRYYRVNGPLDGPASVQGRPVQVVVDTEAVAAGALAELADVVVVDRAHAAGYVDRLTAALAQAGRRREDVAVLGRVRIDADALETPTAVAVDLEQWAEADGLDGFTLFGDDPFGLVRLAGSLGSRSGATLRESVGLLAVAPRVAPEGAA